MKPVSISSWINYCFRKCFNCPLCLLCKETLKYILKLLKSFSRAMASTVDRRCRNMLLSIPGVSWVWSWISWSITRRQDRSRRYLKQKDVEDMRTEGDDALTSDSDGELQGVKIDHGWSWNQNSAYQEIQELKELKQQLARVKWERDEANHRSDLTQREVEVMRAERDDALTRLSAIMSSRLRNNNPNICDLSDKFRPTKLAEVSSELYDNEWTNAFDKLTEEQKTSDTDAIRMLLDVVLVTYQVCKIQVDKQWRMATQFLGDLEDSTILKLIQDLKDQRKANVEKIMPKMLEECQKILINSVQDDELKPHLNMDEGPVHIYLKACVELCLHMVVQDPPVIWNCPKWTPKYFHFKSDSTFGLAYLQSDAAGRSQDVLTGTEMNKKYFREYMKSGNYVEYYVWPAMFLHDNGPLLSKGVAQGANQ